LSTFQELEEFVAAIAPELRARAREIEQNRGVPGDIARRLAAGGLFHLFTPRNLGGLELPTAEGHRLLGQLAEADMSTAWCCMIGSTAGMTTAYLDPKVVRSLVPTRETIVCGVSAPSGTAVIEGDYYRVSGRWQWGSSSNNADHMFLGCFIKRLPDEQTDRPPEVRLVLIPKELIERPDTWHTMGLAGTSSGDIVVKDALVPIAYSCSPVAKDLRAEGDLYKMPYVSSLALGIAAVTLGNAQAALSDILEIAVAKTPTGTAGSLATKPYAQIRIVELRASLQAAKAFFFDAIDRVWSKVIAGRSASPHDRAELRMSAVYAGRTAAEVTRGAYELAGGTSIFTDHVLQRRLRDAQVATQHRMISEVNNAPIGQTLFGLGSHELLDQFRI
jgi:indole-3-acetate monooxygenase